MPTSGPAALFIAWYFYAYISTAKLNPQFKSTVLKRTYIGL